MYACSLELPAPVVGVTTRPWFTSDDDEEEIQVEFICSLSNGKLALLRSTGLSDKVGVALIPGFQPPSLLMIVDPFNINNLSNETDEGDSSLSLKGMSLRDITIIDAHVNSLTVAAVSCPMAASGAKHTFIDHLVEVTISWGHDVNANEGPVTSTTDVMITSSLPLEDRALRIVNWSDTAYSIGARGSALLELADGSLLEYSRGGVLEPCESGPLLEACPWIAGMYDASNDASLTSVTTDSNALKEGHDDESSKRLVIGLSSRYRLYCGERLLSNASSSFIISLQHRFVTHVTIASQPQVHFLPLASLRDFDPLMGSDENNMTLDGYEPRSVERGARLVAIFPAKPFAVIQMPRGNLESISPRALVLPYVMMKIQEGNFRTALDIMRRQRVDMNLIVDLDPTAFLNEGGAEEFIGQIEKIDYVNLFLSSLIDVDTTLWKYPIPSWILAERSTAAATSLENEDTKTNKVCKKVRQIMLDAERAGVTASGKIVKEGHFLLPILSTFAKESPPKLEEALSLIKGNATRDSSKKSTRKSVLLSEHVQSSIQYLAFLADYEIIFNTAIGMYDFDLAKAVARHSQMDPKIYLPMLKHWKELPESTARYEVDVKLKRYESALRHLVNSGQHTEDNDEDHTAKCLKFVEEHSLHKLGLDLFRNDKANTRSIMVSLGERLLLDRKPGEALTVFLAANPRHLGGGKRASRACGDWRTYFACCAEDGEVIGFDQSTDIAESISSQVANMGEQRKNYASAATILIEYAEDVSYAMDMFISAHLWAEGRRVSHLHKRVDLVKKVVDGSVSYARTCIEDLDERASTFTKSNERYAEVIVIRRDAIREAEEAGLNDLQHDDSASMFSMQSVASNNSLRSNASGTSVGSVGSVGSVASVSTVISVGATSTFSFTGEMDSMKHASKYNKLGRDKKKKKKQKKKPKTKRMKPGSEEELNELLTTLGHTCPDEHFVDVIDETITFLLQTDKQSMATLLFQSYKDLESAVAQSQAKRLRLDQQEREKEERKDEHLNEFTEHPCEKDTNGIKCRPLSSSVENTFSYLISL